MGRTLAPLRLRRTRVVLLLSSYLDAAEEPTVRELTVSSTNRRYPGRNLELWPFGSYPEIEDGLERLAKLAPKHHWATWQEFVRGLPARNGRMSARGLGFLLSEVGSDVFVPAVVSEAAGYVPSEAAAYQRPVRKGR